VELDAPRRLRHKAAVRRTFAILPLALVGCDLFDPGAEAKEHVRRMLIDPESAQFRDVRQNGPYTCGEVNSKNRMGGYTGFRKFFGGSNSARIDPDWESATLPDDRIRLLQESTEFTNLYTAYCIQPQ
jgi:hypothetical protein